MLDFFNAAIVSSSGKYCSLQDHFFGPYFKKRKIVKVT